MLLMINKLKQNICRISKIILLKENLIMQLINGNIIFFLTNYILYSLNRKTYSIWRITFIFFIFISYEISFFCSIKRSFL